MRTRSKAVALSLSLAIAASGAAVAPEVKRPLTAKDGYAKEQLTAVSPGLQGPVKRGGSASRRSA